MMIKILNKIKYLFAFIAVVLLAPPAFAQLQLRDSSAESGRRVQPSLAQIALKDLPAEAREVLVLIEKGGPFPFDPRRHCVRQFREAPADQGARVLS